MARSAVSESNFVVVLNFNTDPKSRIILCLRVCKNVVCYIVT